MVSEINRWGVGEDAGGENFMEMSMRHLPPISTKHFYSQDECDPITRAYSHSIMIKLGRNPR